MNLVPGERGHGRSVSLVMEINASMLELLTWVTARERTYEDVVEAWKSNCPRYASGTTR